MLIYKATNTVNGKIYIGKTHMKLSRRKSQHKYAAFHTLSPTYFCKAIRKYGWDAFEWEIIDTAATPEELCEKETHWIEFYKSFGTGYNSNAGGDGQHGFTHSEETREKLRKAHTGRKLTKEHRRKLSEARKGRVFTEETRAKISAAQKGKKKPHTAGEKSGMSKLKESDVIEIKKLLASGISQYKVAERFNVGRTTIGFIQRGETWAHVEVFGFTPTTRKTGISSGAANRNATITEEVALAIKKELAKGELSQREIAAKLGASEYQVSNIKRGKTWVHLTI